MSIRVLFKHLLDKNKYFIFISIQPLIFTTYWIPLGVTVQSVVQMDNNHDSKTFWLINMDNGKGIF